jgi:hypothetical protein
MFAIISNGVIALLVPASTAFEWDSINYPSNWCNLSSPEEKAAIGMVDVVYGNRVDDRYYWVSQDEPIYADGVVKINYTATPKDFDQVKLTVLAEINRYADTLLAPSDYMSIKAMETSVPMADSWKTWRAQIRSQAQDAKTAIAAATSVDEIVTARTIVWANDPNWKANV